jgi:hypothetical protein
MPDGAQGDGAGPADGPRVDTTAAVDGPSVDTTALVDGPRVDTTAPNPSSDDGGCSVGYTAPSPQTLLALLLIALWIRRR